MDDTAGWNLEVENEEGHGDREDAVAQCGEPLDALSGDLVIGGGHGKSGHSVLGSRLSAGLVQVLGCRAPLEKLVTAKTAKDPRSAQRLSRRG